jgi:hypothetical protein
MMQITVANGSILLTKVDEGKLFTNHELVSFDSIWTSPFHPDPHYPYHLVNSEGKHLFILNKTAWAFFVMDDPRSFLKKAKSQGINVLRVALEGTPYFETLGYDIWPWGETREKPDFNSFNDKYWTQVEERVQMAGELGIGINLTLYFSLQKSTLKVEEQKRYWQQILSRLGKYSNILTWEIMNEYTGQETFQDTAGMFFHSNDIWKRPVCSSAGTTDNALWPNKPWMDLAIVHTCTGSTEKHDLLWWYLSVARNTRQYGKPAFNNESGREIRHKNDDPVHRRKQGWLWSAAGCFWTYHSWEGCEGINDLNYFGPGQEFLRNMSLFFNSQPFWKMSPNYTSCQIRDNALIATTLSDPESAITLTYCCTPKSDETARDKKAFLRLPNGEYNISFISPISLNEVKSILYESASLGNVAEIDIPDFKDDILIKIEKITNKERTIIKGTE